MPHLPNEIWLLIAEYCEPRDLWLSLRPVSRQLQQCTEQHFERNILPNTVLNLPVVIPTYDVRIPIRGKVVFTPVSDDSSSDRKDNSNHKVYSMVETDPDYYRPHFLTRWVTMQDRETGRLDDRRVRWELELYGQRRGVSLHECTAVKQGCEKDEVRVSFEWTYTLTSFFRFGSMPLW